MQCRVLTIMYHALSLLFVSHIMKLNEFLIIRAGYAQANEKHLKSACTLHNNKYSRGCPSNPAIDHTPSVGGASLT